MNRIPHIFAQPALAGLTRAGGSAARCMAGLDDTEARLLALDTGLEEALDGHVLVAPPAWEPLTAGDVPTGRLSQVLGQISDAAGQVDGARFGQSADIHPESIGARDMGRLSGTSQGAALRAGVASGPEPDTRNTTKPREARRGVAETHRSGGADPENNEAAVPSGIPQATRWSQELGALAKAGAERAVTVRAQEDSPESDWRSPSTLRLFAGDRNTQNAPLAAPTGLPPAAERRISALLSKLDGGEFAASAASAALPQDLLPHRAAGAEPKGNRIVPEGTGGQTGSAPIPVQAVPTKQATPDPASSPLVDAPRTGLARLLERGRRANITPQHQSADPQGRLAADRSTALATDARAKPDLAPSLSGLAPASRAAGAAPMPSASSVADTSRASDPHALAEAINDLLRREARAAGVDLKGGR